MSYHPDPPVGYVLWFRKSRDGPWRAVASGPRKWELYGRIPAGYGNGDWVVDPAVYGPDGQLVPPRWRRPATGS